MNTECPRCKFIFAVIRSDEYSRLKEERDSFEHTIHEQQIEISRLTQMNVNHQRRVKLQEEKIMKLEEKVGIDTSEKLDWAVPTEEVKHQDHFEPNIADGEPKEDTNCFEFTIRTKDQLIKKLESQLKSQVKLYDDLHNTHGALLKGIDELRSKRSKYKY